VHLDPYPFEPPEPVQRAALIHTWSELSLVHWPYSADAVQALLPPGLEVETFDGAAWVGLVPFHCTIRPPFVPRIPWACSFPEMNVRTYVRGPEGPGVWFISLEAARLGAVLIARATYGLSYYWAKMAFTRVGDVAVYRSKRRWPGTHGAAGALAVAVGDPTAPGDLNELERFLMNRWRFYCVTPAGLATGTVEHEAWSISRADLLHCDPDLVSACGLTRPSGDPLVHHADPVVVRMSAPRRVRV
jgi:uncharacterized protein YqjF (DUF2071 family)